MGNPHDCYACPRYTDGLACASGYHKSCADHLSARHAERESIRAKIKIRTEHVFPPIPVREWDWSAVDDNTYEPGCPIGWGRTKQAAIDNLIQQIQDWQ